MSNIITKIQRKKGLNYRIDKEGNIIEGKYNLLRDPWTLVTLTIIVLVAVFYLQMNQSLTIEKNFEGTCLMYMDLRQQWFQANPGEFNPTLEEIMNYGENKDPNPPRLYPDKIKG